MSATPIPCTSSKLPKSLRPEAIFADDFPGVIPRCAIAHLRMRLRSAIADLRRRPGIHTPIVVMDSGLARSTRAILAARSTLDIGRPCLFDQVDHRVRHRNVVEFLGHLAALGES